jgi:hypothetical protein
MSWKLVEVEDDTEDTLTDGELIGIRVILSSYMGEPEDDRNVYFRAYAALETATRKALKNEENL